jgi:hypothetical protein
LIREERRRNREDMKIEMIRTRESDGMEDEKL